MGKLTLIEAKTLKIHEETIERGQNIFMDVGRALLAIREENLYCNVSDTFESYIRIRWGKSISWAYQQIASMEAADDIVGLSVDINNNGEAVSTIVEKGDIKESHARELAKLETAQERAAAIAKAAAASPVVDGKPRITVSALRTAIRGDIDVSEVKKRKKTTQSKVSKEEKPSEQTEAESTEWELNADEHKSLVDAINAFARFLDRVMAEEDSSEYIRHVETRLRSDMKNLKTTVWQMMPVGIVRGKILTRQQQQSRKK